MNEFDMIAKYFAPLAKDSLANDAAVIDIPVSHQLIVTSDTLNAGTHFMADANPADIAHKCLRTNISDLYAMGASPLCYQLNIACPIKPEEQWVKAFTHALNQDQCEFGIYCSGGDTTTINGALSISITAMGLIKNGKAWTRNGAQGDDAIVVNNTIGDAYIGLKVLQSKIKTDDNAYFVSRYEKPHIKSATCNPSAAIDISDGLAADLTHICKASNKGAVIDINDIPLSKPAQKLIDQGLVTYEDLICGGDDYALLMTMRESEITSDLHRIGTVTNSKIIFNDKNGQPLRIKKSGWTHF